MLLTWWDKKSQQNGDTGISVGHQTTLYETIQMPPIGRNGATRTYGNPDLFGQRIP